jgi:hypothetical protein
MSKTTISSLYSVPAIIKMVKSRRMRWAGHVAHIKEKRNACIISMRKTEKDTTRKRRKWDNNIKLNFREMGHAVA